jgi:isopenicillin N synthase-like dioxygenase
MTPSRLRDLKAFDDTNAGVKGLVDAGATALPSFFHHPPENLPKPVDTARQAGGNFTIPVIDLASATTTDQTRRAKVVGEVLAAAKKVGFFQVVNHGVPEAAMSGMLAAVRGFHEEPVEVKRAYYTRDYARSVRYHCNMDLFRAPAAKWRDTVYMDMAPNEPAPEETPAALRGIAAEYTRQVKRLGSTLLGLLSEALGVRSGYLEQEAGCLDGIVVGAHYYPACPEPHLTMGATTHSDHSFITVLLQDAVGSGALQVLIQDSDVEEEEGRWIDVHAMPGAFVVNIGDFLQLISNGRFKSVQHRVVSKKEGPRVSVACFFQTCGEAAATRVCSPIVSNDDDGTPPLYRSATVEELLVSFREKNGRSALDRFRL